MARRCDITILTPWIGARCSWLESFDARMAANPMVRHVVVHTTERNVKARIAEATGVIPPDVITPRKLCDYRFAFRAIFAELVDDFPWWGWCDMDCIFGDLSTFLTPEVLEQNDYVTDHPYLVNGPFTIVKDSPATRVGFEKRPGWEEVFTDPKYHGWDEPHQRVMVPLRGHHPVGVHTHDREEPQPYFDGAKLRSSVDGRELMTYHFAQRKMWPL